MNVSLENTLTTRFVGFDDTNTHMYLLTSQERNTVALEQLNLHTGVSKTLAVDARADIDIFTTHPTQHHIQAIKTTYDKPSYKVLDQSIAHDMTYLNIVMAMIITEF